MNKNAVIDLETLGIADRSIILQITIAVCTVDDPMSRLLSDDNILDLKIAVEPQKTAGRIIDPDTVAWWNRQDKALRNRIILPSQRDIHPREVYGKIKSFLEAKGYDRENDFVWQRGSKDIDWLTSFLEDFGTKFQDIPFSWSKVRDIRTAVDVLGASSRLDGRPDGLTKMIQENIKDYIQHDAKCDVKENILVLQNLGIMGDTPPF